MVKATKYSKLLLLVNDTKLFECIQTPSHVAC